MEQYFIIAGIVFIILCLFIGIGEGSSYPSSSSGDILTFILISILASVLWPLTVLTAFGFLLVSIGKKLARK